ncbi:MAG: polymerase, sigma-24 subunit, RpoE [Bacteroidetes bacterium]|jgi:RNA polymerase sigma-70 factor (ECF subfamily)|nr:polymerase, sigma-24 subunit, RpoE [Bacteroidota bacterium]
MKDTGTSDAALVELCRRGNTRAFDELVGKYQKTLFNVALRMTADYDASEEVTQQAFVRAYERIASFDPRFKFFSWMYRILVNTALDHLEERKRHDRLDDEVPSDEPDPSDLGEREDSEAMLQAGLMDLTAEQRAVIVLRHFEDLTYEEIGAVLDIPEKTVKSRLFSARMQLRAVLVKRGYRFHG